MRWHVIVAAALFLPKGAGAALPPCAYDEGTAQAAMVLQVDRTEILAPDANGNCRMRGTVIRSFRGPIAEGTRIESTVACAWDGMIGAQVYWERDDLMAAPVLELHIRPGRGGVGWVLMLDAPTEGSVWRGTDCEGRPLGG